MSLMGELKFFLGLQIHQSPRGIFINQAKYALEILKKHGMDKCDIIGTPMATKPKLYADLSCKQYATMHVIKQDLQKITSKHLKEVKRIFRYLKGTINMGLLYSKDSGFELTAFLDADYAGCLDTRKSTYGGIHFLGEKLNIRVILFSIYSDDGNPSRANIKQALRYQDYQDKYCQGRLLASFQDDAKYENVDQDTGSQDGKDDKDKQGKRFKDLKTKDKVKRQ
ncbi:hypothetical protein Tco_1400517 [Tanacetum coccineum]